MCARFPSENGRVLRPCAGYVKRMSADKYKMDTCTNHWRFIGCGLIHEGRQVSLTSRTNVAYRVHTTGRRQPNNNFFSIICICVTAAKPPTYAKYTPSPPRKKHTVSLRRILCEYGLRYMWHPTADLAPSPDQDSSSSGRSLGTDHFFCRYRGDPLSSRECDSPVL